MPNSRKTKNWETISALSVPADSLRAAPTRIGEQERNVHQLKLRSGVTPPLTGIETPTSNDGQAQMDTEEASTEPKTSKNAPIAEPVADLGVGQTNIT